MRLMIGCAGGCRNEVLEAGALMDEACVGKMSLVMD